MASTSQSSDALQNELKAKQICRFCLTQQQDKLASIYQRDARLKSTAPLPVQVMACVSIEVFSNDGMPSLICSDCRLLFEHAYRFKQMCKRAEMLLRQFPLTGQWPNPLSKPKFPKELLPSTVVAQMQQPQGKSSSANKEPAQSPPVLPTNKPLKSFDISLPKKLLNADPAESPEPPIPTRFKKEKLDKETTNFLDKVENNEELSMDDVHRLIAATDEDDAQLAGTEQSAVSPQTPKSQTQTTPTTRSKPKLLNKSSIRILNKDAEIVLEPRLSAPQLKRDEDGNMAVVTEILDPQASYEPELDPVKDVTPVETVVFPCPHCERSFPLRQLRDIHMLNHTRNRSFQCSECDKSFFSKYDLQKHNLIHTGDRPFKCTVCDKAFTRATLLHRHEKTHTDIPKFICIYCEKPFISKEQMEKHSERHLKNRPYQCSVCKKSFAFKQGLERHEVIHSREQPYPCQYCEQSFSTPSKLARHLTAHAGKRPYPCKFCPKSYLLSHHLTRHLRSHKYGTVAFMCSDCGKVFKTRDELIYHSAVHATQTLVCPLCKETFQDIQTVTEHIKEHAEGDAFACEFCDLIFMTAERLQQHTDMEHVGDLAAYHEDEAKTQRQLEDTKEADNGAKDNYKSTEGLHILEETIEEFLVDELPDGVNNSNSVVNIKEEHEWTNQTNNQPQVLNQIVYDPKLKSNSGEYFVLSENLTTEANAEFEAAEYEDVAVEAQPPAKIRKILNPRSQVVKSVQQQQPPNQQSTSSIQTRRKIAELSSQKISLNEIKIEKDEETITENCSSNPSHSSTSTINSVLKMLPKSVSVRRNASSIESNVTTENSQARASQLQDTRPASCNSSEGNNIAVTKRGAASGRNSSSREQQSNKKSPSSAATASTDDAISPNQSSILRNIPGASKTVKMMLGHKKVKVQKITLTKAEAAAMTRDGRIRMKDGTLVLTKVAK